MTHIDWRKVGKLAIQNKIKQQHELVDIVEKAKSLGKKIVTYGGSFDVLHIGHVIPIHEAKKQGDILIILLNTDKSIRSYKGPKRPIISQEERAMMLASLEAVDYICFFDEINPINILSKIKPGIHCKGQDWGKDCVERAVVEDNGGEIYLLGWVQGHSSTDLIKKIIDVESSPTVKAIFLDRDGTINDNKNGYTHKKEEFKFLPGVIEGLKRLSQTDYKILINTNQSGIGRKIFTEENFHKLNDWMFAHLLEQGVRIDKVYFCPHHPDDECDCRKPGIGLFLKAVDDFGVRLDKSWLIGDSDSDVQAGRRANIKTIKLGERVNQELKLEPNYYAKDFGQAIDIIFR